MYYIFRLNNKMLNRTGKSPVWGVLRKSLNNRLPRLKFMIHAGAGDELEDFSELI